MTPYQQAINQINQKYSGTTTTSAPPKPNLLQKTGNFLGNVAKAVINPFARVGVEGYNLGAAGIKTAQGDIAGANAELDKPRNLPLLGETKPTLTNSYKPGLNQALDVAGQGIQLGSLGMGGEGFGSGIVAGAKTGATVGATQGFGNALTQTEGKSFGQNVGNIAGQTAIGGATGGVIGGAAAAIHPIFTRSTPIMDPATGNPYDVQAATANREVAGTNAVQGINQINQTAQGELSKMGQEFKQGATNIETTNPGVGMDIPKPVADQLKSIKESAKFALPDFVANKDWTIATPTQAQDLITQLNRATFQAKASGEFAVNQQLIDLTNQIKDSASQSFGSEWDKVYSNYSQGRTALDKLDGIINLDPKASPAELNKQLTGLNKLNSTPEGKKIIQQAIDAFKKERGVDLTDPVAVVNYVSDAQKALKVAEKGSHGHQVMEALKSPRLEARHLWQIVETILGITAGAKVLNTIGKKFFSGGQ